MFSAFVDSISILGSLSIPNEITAFKIKKNSKLALAIHPNVHLVEMQLVDVVSINAPYKHIPTKAHTAI